MADRAPVGAPRMVRMDTMSGTDDKRSPSAETARPWLALAERVMRPLHKVQSRPNGAWETSRKKGVYRRLTLRRADGRVYLNRWGLALDRTLGGVLLHRMDAPDPGIDLHDHPWWFVSIVLWGGYTELRAGTRIAQEFAKVAEWNPNARRGIENRRRVGSIQIMRLDECHTITDLHRRSCWTLVIRGPRRRKWGFYLPGGWMAEARYDATVRAERRDLWSEQNAEARPW